MRSGSSLDDKILKAAADKLANAKKLEAQGHYQDAIKLYAESTDLFQKVSPRVGGGPRRISDAHRNSSCPDLSGLLEVNESR